MVQCVYLHILAPFFLSLTGFPLSKTLLNLLTPITSLFTASFDCSISYTKFCFSSKPGRLEFMVYLKNGMKVTTLLYSHIVVVLTSHPLRSLLNNPKIIGWLAYIVIELGEHDIKFILRYSIKAQAFVDFVTKFTNSLKVGDIEKKLRCVIWK